MRTREHIRLLGLVILEVVVVMGLHSLGRLDGFAIDWSDLDGWLEDSPFEDAAGSVLLLIALVLAYWVVISTVSYALVSQVGRPSSIRAVGWLTLPPIKRLVRRAVAVSIAASSVVGPVAPAIAELIGAEGASQVVVEVDSEGRLRPPGTEPSVDAEEEPGVILPPHLGAREDGDRSEPPAAEPLDGTVSHHVTVRRGDHLWSLSERHLARVLGRGDLSEQEIARYWVTVIEMNRSAIRSGNPDLIYPGETILLPEVKM